MTLLRDLAFAVAAGGAIGAVLAVVDPAHADGPTLPGAHLWPPEPEYRVTVLETTCTALRDCCGVHRDCGGGPYHPSLGRDPAPVPLPSSGLLMLAACGLLWRMRA